MAAVPASIPMGNSQTPLQDGSSVISQPSPRVLHSWKEIASYLGHGVRTIQRYEVQLGLPIHRPAAKERTSVLAFADELEQWLRRTPSRNGTHSNRADAKSSAQLCVSRLRCVAVYFLKNELEIGNTFAHVALSAKYPDRRERNKAHARRAYDAALKFLGTVPPDVQDEADLNRRLEHLRTKLRKLGEAL